MNIRLESLSKSYEALVLKEINYTFEAGKLYVIKGISGCGKTTLLNCIGGVENDFEGQIIKPASFRSAYIFQQSLLLSGLSVRENMKLTCKDEGQIESLAEGLGIKVLLDKQPEMLSGGERQRASVLRALLSDPHLLLADEPTASLDGRNASQIAELIASLRNPARILIVATHDPYFDEYADEIILLDYGRIEAVQRKNEVPGSFTQKETISEIAAFEVKRAGSLSNTFRTNLRYVIARRPGLLKLKNILLNAIYFFLILVISSVQNNIASESVRLASKDKPVELLRIEEDQLALLTEEDRKNITFYDDYFAEQGDITAYYITPKEYSVLMVPGIISFGTFPETEDEILVNETMAAAIVGDNASPGDAVGKEIVFCGLNCRISGVVGTYRQDFRLDYYYCYAKNGKPFDFHEKHLFMPYERLKLIGTKFERPVVMAIWPGLLEDGKAVMRLSKAGFAFNQYFLNAQALKQSADLLGQITYAVLIVLFLIACLYISSLIRLELFYRKRELGFLQIFGLSKRRIKALILLEHGIKTVASFIAALLLHSALVLLYALFNGTFPWPDAGTVLALSILLCLLNLGTVFLTGRKFLKQSIVKLIV